MGSEIGKKDITRLGFRSSLLLQRVFVQGCSSFTWAMLPILKKIYKDDKPGLSAAMKDNLEFINTHPESGRIPDGVLNPMKKGENRNTSLALKWHCLAQSPGLAMRFWFFVVVAGICS